MVSRPVTSLRPQVGQAIAIIVMGTFAPQVAARTPIYARLAGFMEGLGHHTVVISLPKIGLGDFDSMLDQLEHKIFETYRDHPIILIGHSQGAVAVHALAHRRPLQTQRVFAVSPPTHGTWLAGLPGSRWVPIARHLGSHSPQMREVRLRRDYPADQIHVFYSMLDQFVLPFVSSQIRDAHNVLIAPRAAWGWMLRLDQRLSQGVTMVDGVCDHLTIMMSPIIRDHIRRVLEVDQAPEPLVA